MKDYKPTVAFCAFGLTLLAMMAGATFAAHSPNSIKVLGAINGTAAIVFTLATLALLPLAAWLIARLIEAELEKDQKREERVKFLLTFADFAQLQKEEGLVSDIIKRLLHLDNSDPDGDRPYLIDRFMYWAKFDHDTQRIKARDELVAMALRLATDVGDDHGAISNEKMAPVIRDVVKRGAPLTKNDARAWVVTIINRELQRAS